ncbi:MAG: DUF4925 domain-containing protein [Bacteroides sp.]|nr:DUF4925 domain-containing protein [Bacteroides sp.]
MEDGNIVATYHNLPDDLGDLLGGILVGGSIEKPTTGWQTSPLNLASYYVEDGYLYVVPQLEMIMAAVAARDNASEPSVIVELLEIINKWLTDGVRLNLNTDMTAVAGGKNEFVGDLEIYVDKKSCSLFWLLFLC